MKASIALQIMSLFLFLGCTFETSAQTQEKIKISYKIGDVTNTFEARSISATVKTETVEDKSNSSLAFTINDYNGKVTFRFVIKDEKIVTDFTGKYPLRFPGGFQDGESIQSTNIMIIDTQNATNTYQTRPGGTCDITLVGNKLSVNIKNATIWKSGTEVPFEFSFTSPNTKVTRR